MLTPLLKRFLTAAILIVGGLSSGVVSADATAPGSGGADSGGSGGLPVVTVQDFFNVHPADKSALLMREIFGPIAWQQATGWGGDGDEYGLDVGTSARSALDGGIIGALSSVLNLACMVLTVIIVGWGLFSANASATIQGLGVTQRYDPVWVPVRSVLSVGLLLPVVGGYSLIQVIGMKAVFLSIGIANAGYSVVLAFLYAGIPTIPVSTPNVDEVVQAVFIQEACRAAVVDEDGAPQTQLTTVGPTQSLAPVEASRSGLGLITNTVSAITTSIYTASIRRKLIYSEAIDGVRGNTPRVCGALTLTQFGFEGEAVGPESAAGRALFDARVAAVVQLRQSMSGLVGQIVSVLQSGAGGSTMPSESGGASDVSPFLGVYDNYGTIKLQYRNALTLAAGRAARTMQLARNEGKPRFGLALLDRDVIPDGAEQTLKNGGWLMTGSIYWALSQQAKFAAEMLKDLGVETSVPAEDYLNLRYRENSQVMRQMFAIAERVVDKASTDFTESFDSGEERAFVHNYGRSATNYGGAAGFANDLLEKWGAFGVTDIFMGMMGGDGDVIGSLTTMGQYSWNAGWTMLSLQLVAPLIDKIPIVAGLNAAKNAKSKATGEKNKSIGAGIAAFAMALALPLLLLGFFAGFYLPGVPMILWLFNIIGWMIQVAKSIIAFPVWAVAHAIPEGEGIAGMTARQGYILVIGIVLRPLLLVFGIMLGAVILAMVGWLMRFMMPLTFAGIDVQGAPGFMSVVAYAIIYVAIAIAAAMKCFALSHELADEILEWIGGNARTLGDGRSIEGLQGSTAGTARTIADAGGGGMRAAGEARRAAGAATKGADARPPSAPPATTQGQHSTA